MARSTSLADTSKGNASTKEPPTIVIFRKWKDTGDILALFPRIPSDNAGNLCSSYEHVGQHGGADYYGCICATRPAKPSEYADLKQELTQRGYNLVPRPRATYSDHEARRNAS